MAGTSIARPDLSKLRADNAQTIELTAASENQRLWYQVKYNMKVEQRYRRYASGPSAQKTTTTCTNDRLRKHPRR